MNINDYKDGNGNIKSTVKLIEDLITNITNIQTVNTINANNFNGWTGTVTVTKDHTGLVSLQGMLTAGTTTANTVICNIPNAYRPKEVILVIARSYRASGDEIQPIRLSTDGNIAIATRTAGENVQINIQYRV